jgi:hypothetical protein
MLAKPRSAIIGLNSMNTALYSWISERVGTMDALLSLSEITTGHLSVRTGQVRTQPDSLLESRPQRLHSLIAAVKGHMKFHMKTVRLPSNLSSDKRSIVSETKATVYLVSCVKKKRDKACAAQDFYASNWFRKARRYVEKSGCVWFILSAKYGLVSPGDVISPYEQTLTGSDKTYAASGFSSWRMR